MDKPDIDGYSLCGRLPVYISLFLGAVCVRSRIGLLQADRPLLKFRMPNFYALPRYCNKTYIFVSKSWDADEVLGTLPADGI